MNKEYAVPRIKRGLILRTVCGDLLLHSILLRRRVSLEKHFDPWVL